MCKDKVLHIFNRATSCEDKWLHLTLGSPVHTEQAEQLGLPQSQYGCCGEKENLFLLETKQW